MKTTEMKNATKQELRKAMRAMDDMCGEVIITARGQIKKIGKRYAFGPVPELDDSDILTDYSAWTYGCTESLVLEWAL